MTPTQQATADLINQLRTDVINSLQANGRFASGDTIKALEILQQENEAQLLAPWWIDALEYGRKPTSPTGPYQQSDPSFLDRIKEWVAIKAPELNPYAVWKSINKYGYPGTPGVLTIPLSDDNINMRVNEAGEQMAEYFTGEIVDYFNIFD